jgi:hypothetical protein
MSSEEDKKNQDIKTNKDVNFKVTVDRSPEIEELRKQLAKIQEEKEKAISEAEKRFKEAEQSRLETLKKAEEEKLSIAKEKESLLQEKEDYKTKLDLIAEQEFMKKKNAILERAKKDFSGNETKYKEIEAKLSDPEKGPENLKATEFLLDMVEDAFETNKKALEKAQDEMKKAEEARKAAELVNQSKEAPSGGETALLEGANDPQEKTTTDDVNKYKAGNGRSAEENMILDLYAKARSTNKNLQERAEAEAQIKKLLVKTASKFREEFRHKNPLAPELVEKDNDHASGYSPYNKREEIKTFKEFKKSGV